MRVNLKNSLLCLGAVGALAASAPPACARESVLYSFKGGNDGSAPVAGLINKGKTLFGTTMSGGGSASCTGGDGGCGTVFSLTTSGVENWVTPFPGGTGGNTPEAGLFRKGSTLYGTSFFGGDSGTNCGGAGCGTVFSVPTVGASEPNVVYSFQGSTHGDGAFPHSSLIEVGKYYFGTTVDGGNGGCSGGCGTVFAMTKKGTIAWEDDFPGGTGGNTPMAGLVYDADTGLLYGTTEFGGNSGSNCGGAGCGTVFSVPTGGPATPAVAYSFQGSTHGDGAFPQASLLDYSGTLYGTTANGGGSGCSGGCGTVFSMTTGGIEIWVSDFPGGSGGNTPVAGLALDLGTGLLYGTTEFGGNSGNNCGGAGCGTIFSIPTGGESEPNIAYSFQGSTQNGDGAFPQAGLLDLKGALYGTTQQGGSYNLGAVFKFTL